MINITLGYQCYLPDNWICEVKSDSQHCFIDTTGAYGAYLSIVRHRIDAATYSTPDEWTIAHFIAYCMYMDYYPFGTVLFADSSITEKQGDLRATELYLRFYTDDTLNYSWDEYVRYAATGSFGYELYALGDTADMAVNIGYYGALLKMIKISTNSAVPIIVSTIPHRITQRESALDFVRPRNFAAPVFYTPQGKRVSSAIQSLSTRSNGVYLSQDKKLNCVISIK
jgi:hypothetical protein